MIEEFVRICFGDALKHIKEKPAGYLIKLLT
jgi:hypothetical protein